MKVASPALLEKISACSTKISHLLPCLLHWELACGLLIEVLQRCSWLVREQRAAQRGKRTHARKWEPKTLPRPATLLDRFGVVTFMFPYLDRLCSFHPKRQRLDTSLLMSRSTCIQRNTTESLEIHRCCRLPVSVQWFHTLVSPVWGNAQLRQNSKSKKNEKYWTDKSDTRKADFDAENTASFEDPIGLPSSLLHFRLFWLLPTIKIRRSAIASALKSLSKPWTYLSFPVSQENGSSEPKKVKTRIQIYWRAQKSEPDTI